MSAGECDARTWFVSQLLVCDQPEAHVGQHGAEYKPGQRTTWREPTVWIDGEEYTLAGGREILVDLRRQIDAIDGAPSLGFVFGPEQVDGTIDTIEAYEAVARADDRVRRVLALGAAIGLAKQGAK